MEKINSKMLNVSIKYGVFTGICYLVFTTITYVFNISMFNTYYGILSFLFSFGVIIIAMVLAMKEIKRKILGGAISYLQCLVSGFLLGLIAFYISGAFNYILYGLIDKNYMPQQLEKFALTLETYNLDESKIQMQLENMRKNMQPIKQFTTSLYSSLLISIVISAIVSIFIKKKDENIIFEGEINNILKD